MVNEAELSDEADGLIEGLKGAVQDFGESIAYGGSVLSKASRLMDEQEDKLRDYVLSLEKKVRKLND